MIATIRRMGIAQIALVGFRTPMILAFRKKGENYLHFVMVSIGHR